jgi:hypothetical protein
MSEADTGPKAEDPPGVEPASTRSREAEKKDRVVAAAILGVAFALSMVVSWQSGIVAEEHELHQD